MVSVCYSPYDRDGEMNDSTLLHRIIKSDWWKQLDGLSSMAFRPSAKDNKLLSVYDGDQISARDAFKHYAKDASKQQPTGVLAVTVQECANEDLPAIPDQNTFPEHVLIDFTQFGTSRIKTKSRHLRNMAEKRGWLYRRHP